MILGWITKSLSYETKRTLKTWKRSNRFWHEFEYNIFERIFITLAERPLKYALRILFLFLISGAILSSPDANIACFLGRISNYPADTLNYFSTLWTVQATIVGLVYPIVIGFVGLLIRNQLADRVLLNAYLTDSSAIFMGLSSLLLVAFMGLQYSVKPFLADFNFHGFLFVDNLWFLFNVSGTAWFLYRTVEFIKPDLQQRNLEKYLANVVYPLEIEKLRKWHFFINAVSYKMIPSADNEGLVNEKQPSIVLHPIVSNFGRAELTRNFQSKVVLRNVFFRPLGLACKLWIKKAIRKGKVTEHVNKPLGMNQDTESLLFTLLPGEVYEGNKSICRSTGSTKLSPIEKLLIRLSFKFNKDEKKEKQITTHDVLLGAKAEIITAIDRGEVSRYQNAICELVELNKILINLGMFVNANGQKENWANLASSPYWPSQSLSEEWNRVYFDIFDRAIAQLQNSDRYFLEVIYIPHALYDSTRSSAGTSVSVSFMRQSFYLWCKLRDWWCNEVEKQGGLLHNYSKPCLLNQPLQNRYREAVYSYIGSWESLLKSIMPNTSDNESIKWEEYHELSVHFEKHLTYTMQMLLNSIYVGDTFAAESMLDVLQKWRASLSHQLVFNNHFIKRPQRLTLDSLLRPKEEVEERLQNEITSSRIDQPPLDEFFATCISNFWRDAVCATLYLLTLWARDAKNDDELPIRFIWVLLSGQPQKEGGGGFISLKPFSSATKLLQSIIRQYYYDGAYGQGYRKRLDSLIESASEIGKPSMIPGRVYSTIGENGLESTQLGQLFLLCITVNSEWSPELQIESDLRDLISTDDSLARNLEEVLQAYLEILDENMLCSLKVAFELIKKNDSSTISFDTARQVVCEGLKSVLEVLKDARR